MIPTKPNVLLLDAGNTLVFFDADFVAGHLVGWGQAISGQALRDAQRHAMLDYQEQLRNAAEGHDVGWKSFVGTLIKGAGVATEAIPELVIRLWEQQLKTNFWRRVPDGTREILVQLRNSGIRLGVVSNSEGTIDELLAEVGLADLFETIVDSGKEGVSKPDPALFKIALERMNVPAQGTLYIGDIPEVDVVGAQRAGLDAILIDGFRFHPDFDRVHRIENLSELDTWL